MQQVSTTRLQEFRKLLNDMIETLSTMKSMLGWRIIGEGVNVLVDWWIRSMTCGRLRLERPVRWIIRSSVFWVCLAFEMLRWSCLEKNWRNVASINMLISTLLIICAKKKCLIRKIDLIRKNTECKCVGNSATRKYKIEIIDQNIKKPSRQLTSWNATWMFQHFLLSAFSCGMYCLGEKKSYIVWPYTVAINCDSPWYYVVQDGV